MKLFDDPWLVGGRRPIVFRDRRAAGQLLATRVLLKRWPGPLTVLGLARGGVPVAYEVARALHAPLEVLVVRKVGMPGEPEFALGAIGPGGVVVRDAELDRLPTDLAPAFEDLAQRERVELSHRERLYRGDAPPLDLDGRGVILVDDGLATGSTMRAAVRAAKLANAARVFVAVPVASKEAARRVRQEADDVVILEEPRGFAALGEWYSDFHQLEDREVLDLLARSRAGNDPGP